MSRSMTPGIAAVAIRPSRHAARPQHGFTLIELLAAIVVLSVGVLGVASMQLQGLRQGKGSLQAAQATALAYSLADMMRGNKAGASSYAITATNFPSLAQPSTNCATTSCNAAQQAAFDTYYWFNDYQYTGDDGSTVTVPGVKSQLGTGATAWVQCKTGTSGTCNSTSVFLIGVFWNRNRNSTTTPTGTSCMNAGSASTTYDANSASELSCVVINVQL